jgi:hypothetical protein
MKNPTSGRQGGAFVGKGFSCVICCMLSHLNCESFETSYLCILIATNHEIAGIDAAIGGPTGHLLEHNVQVIGQIRANLAACKVVYT